MRSSGVAFHPCIRTRWFRVTRGGESNRATRRFPHGIDISPHDGNIHVVDGFTSAVHVFDSTTYAELNASFLTTPTKPVDLEFRRPIPAPAALALLGLTAIATRRRR